MKIAFYSTMDSAPWGGSEALWSQAALHLLEQGVQVAVNFAHWRPRAAALERVVAAEGSLTEREAPQAWTQLPLGRRVQRGLQLLRGQQFSAGSQAGAWLDRERPDLIVITLGSHMDDISLAAECRRRGIPYALNLQVASRFHWLSGGEYAQQYRSAYQQAVRCFFLSAENRHIMEDNLGMTLEHAQIVDNPFNVSWQANPAWPDESEWRLACVGRLHFASKGQDILLNVLRQPKWRARNLRIVFWGEDLGSQEQFNRLVAQHGLAAQVEVAGFTANVEQMWADHHALVLPSRWEGLPMVTVEALLCGRVAIVTRCGRNGELVDDNETGFLAAAAVPELVDEALERAWQRRHEWRAMGRVAHARIRQRYAPQPAAVFAAELQQLAAGQRGRQAA